jgi:N utilization substance protein B
MSVIAGDEAENNGAPRGTNRGAARLAAVQALYQMDLTQKDLNAVLAEFIVHRLEGEGHLPDYEGADVGFFRDIVSGVVQSQESIDPVIASYLAEGWRLSRIDSILRAILRAGVYELLNRPDVPARAAINEYVNVAHAFFGGEEPGVVNGLLDGVARQKRKHELSSPVKKVSKG